MHWTCPNRDHLSQPSIEKSSKAFLQDEIATTLTRPDNPFLFRFIEFVMINVRHDEGEISTLEGRQHIFNRLQIKFFAI
mgnify:FL=1